MFINREVNYEVMGENSLPGEGNNGAIIIPSKQECLDFILLTTVHSCRVHYYLNQLNIKPHDPDSEIPHDLAGPGNKFEWEVMCGLALKGMGEEYQHAIQTSRLLHNSQQYHHLKFNGREYHPEVALEDLQEGAMDVICALLDPRHYYGGSHTLQEIEVMPAILSNPPHKLNVILDLIGKMKKIIEPTLDQIKSLSTLPEKIEGIPEEIYQKINWLAREAVEMVEIKYTLDLPIVPTLKIDK